MATTTAMASMANTAVTAMARVINTVLTAHTASMVIIPIATMAIKKTIRLNYKK